ncbi:MAG: aminotransferase class V-fold PLP-dependent enzyme [Actinomycetia bacterium]|nr:aminotransferase class V-fold PLP-dependent enzyme [Actinomycetes bacterium]
MNIDEIRSDTPGTAHGIHLLAAGSALMPCPVIDAVKDHLDLEARVGGYEAHRLEMDRLEAVYDSVAALVGGRAREIALVENATVAWCQAFYALPFGPGDRVLTCEAEYGANYVAYLQRARRDGIVIDVVPSTQSGSVDVDALDAMIDDRVKLIATTWIPTNGGLVNPAAEIGRVARAHGVPYLLDGCQAVGQMPIDVAELGCDFLSATGRKFLRGPRGTGFLWVRGDLIPDLEPAMIDHYAADWVATNDYELRPDARRFENWENAYALRAGLGAAVDYALDLGIDTIQDRAWGLAARLRSGLTAIPGAKVRDLGDEKCAIVSFTIDGVDPVARVAELRQAGITIGTTDPASTRLDAEARGLPMMFRAAPHYYNTELEVDVLLSSLG